jgi:HK97 gp10 family phage protein
MSLKMEMTISGADQIITLLKSLPAEVVSKGGGPVRSGLRKGARVIGDQAKANLVAVTSRAGRTGESYGTGFTASKVILKRKKPFGTRGERYIVTVKPEAYPNTKSKFRKRPIKANDIAYMLESGTSKQDAEPWMRPAFVAKAPEAISTATREVLAALERVVKRLAKQGRPA